MAHTPGSIKSYDTLKSFVEYCWAHPDERFWQALRNWSGYGFIRACKDFRGMESFDTFHWEGRRHDEHGDMESHKYTGL